MKNYLILFCGILLAGCSATTSSTFIARKGVNISHWLSQSSQRGEARVKWFTRNDVDSIVSFGFDHIRIPVDEEQMFTENGEKEPEAFALLHNALGWCKEFGLKAVVDLHILRSHHFNAAVKPLFTDAAAQEQWYRCWRMLSEELHRYPNDMVAYELMNEPVADKHEDWNIIVNRCLQEVRKLEPERTIIIGSNRWQGFATVPYLRLPEGDKHLIISFHYYEPFLLTHYRASWTDNKDYTGPVHYPGRLVEPEDLATQSPEVQARFAAQTRIIANRETIGKDFQVVDSVAKHYGYPVYCGEFGCILATPVADRNAWYRDMCSLFHQFNFGYATWDYKGSFGIKRNGKWVKEIIDALTKTPQ